MSQKYEKLKTLLMELFQLDQPDQPDLDFGLYRTTPSVVRSIPDRRAPAVRAA